MAVATNVFMRTTDIYLDNAATTRIDPKVAAAMRPLLAAVYGNASSVHRLGVSAARAIEQARGTLAGSLGVQPDEIVFTSGGTESNNLALKGRFFARARGENHIVTTVIEHPSVLATCEWLRKHGCRVTYLPVDREGFVDPADVRKAISGRTLVVSIAHANHEIGTIQAIGEMARVCAERGVCFHTDVCQAFTKAPLGEAAGSVSLVSLNAHKIHGPKGVGALLVRTSVVLDPLLTGGQQERGLRAGTQNAPGIVGFGKAVELADPRAVDRMAVLRDRLIDRLFAEVPGTTLNGPRHSRLCNNVNVTFESVLGMPLMLELSKRGLCVSTGSACLSGSTEPSHVLLAIGLSRSRAGRSLRLSLSKWTTPSEIDDAVACLRETVAAFRKKSR